MSVVCVCLSRRTTGEAGSHRNVSMYGSACVDGISHLGHGLRYDWALVRRVTVVSVGRATGRRWRRSIRRAGSRRVHGQGVESLRALAIDDYGSELQDLRMRSWWDREATTYL